MFEFNINALTKYKKAPNNFGRDNLEVAFIVDQVENHALTKPDVKFYDLPLRNSIKEYLTKCERRKL